MRRRGFLATLAALPFAGRWLRADGIAWADSPPAVLLQMDAPITSVVADGDYVFTTPWIDLPPGIFPPKVTILGLEAWMPDETTPLTRSVDRTFRG